MPRTDLKGITDIGTITAEDIDGIGNEQGKGFKDTVKTSQLRNFYSAVNGIRVQFQREKKVTTKIERSLILLKPKLAYAAGRHSQLKNFNTFMVQAIDGVVKSGDKPQAMNNFFDLLEAVVAYHKFHGGQDK